MTLKFFLKPPGLTFVELMIVIGLIVVLSTVGIATYLTFHQSALRTNEIRTINSMVHQARFRAIKPSDGSDFGIHLDPENQTVELFRETYQPSNVIEKKQLYSLSIGSLNLQPNLGVTNEILFEKITGKTLNSGNFTLERPNFIHTFTLNAQGTIN